jgi:predicted XRE-type DNA-binding protein
MSLTMNVDMKVTPSSGNVFADLGFKNADERLAKAELSVRIAAAIKARKLTLVAAAELCGIDQPKVSKLVRGELYGFSTDQLFRFLTALGQDVEIVVHDRPPRKRNGKGKLTVRAA